jgi:hypothetical protein
MLPYAPFGAEGWPASVHVSHNLGFVNPDVILSYLIKRMLQMILNVVQTYQNETVQIPDAPRNL